MTTQKTFDIKKYLLHIMLISFFVIMCFAHENFLTAPNVFNILRNIAMQGIIAFAVTLCVINGEIDLSVGSTVACTGIIFGLVFGKMNLPEGVEFGIALLISLILGVLIAALHTVLVIEFYMPSMIATLSTQLMFFGIASVVTGGFPVLSIPKWFRKIGSLKLGGQFPITGVYVIIMFFVLYFILTKTKYGRNIYAVGGNREAARLSGINVVKTKFTSFLITQWCSVLSGIFLTAQTQAGSAQNGKEWWTTIISAVVIGGTSLSGGIGTLTGTVIGLLFLGVINNAMTLFNISDYVQFVVRGGLMIFAVILNKLQTKKK